ncbi:MAG TPA: pantoate--beta-alanine ligase [Bacteroidota bacterium]|nr:pantoate--beta-alanine ligase [Bacteroidota bacterium]
MIEQVHITAAMRQASDALRARGKTIAVVPTMGALHEGHRALIREARARADAVVVTLYVNPTQFGPHEDYSRYPRDPARDAAVAEAGGADYLFVPGDGEMYGPGFQTFITVEQLSTPLEGASRPGHFRGVATVVAKLFQITNPHYALFGQKDAQQVAVVRRLIRDLNFPVELVVVPTVRGEDGLALSSRNAYLSSAERAEAPVLYRSLVRAEEAARGGERSAAALASGVAAMVGTARGASLEYVAVVDAETLQPLSRLEPGGRVLICLAARFGATRLIDNVQFMV